MSHRTIARPPATGRLSDAAPASSGRLGDERAAVRGEERPRGRQNVNAEYGEPSPKVHAVRGRVSVCPVRLTDRRLFPHPSYQCAPFQRARKWPASADGTATAAPLVLTHPRYLKQLLKNFESWDELFLSSGSQVTSLIVQADATRLAATDVESVFANLTIRAAPECLPAALDSAHWSAHLTPRNNLVLLLLRAVWVPPVSVSLERAALARPPGYGGCHPTQTAEYSIGTKWYAYEMLELEALRYFDFVLKVDADNSFRALLRPTPAEAMVGHGAYYLHTGFVFRTNSRCDATNDEAASTYMLAAQCKHTLRPRALAQRIQWGSCFTGGWLGLLQSPQVLAYAAFWWNWPGGWLHRWGDQELWPLMLDVVNESSSIVEAAAIRRTAFSSSSGCPYVSQTNATWLRHSFEWNQWSHLS